VWVLVANSYPPFQKELIIKEIYPTSLEVLYASIFMYTSFSAIMMLLAPVVRGIKELVGS